MSKHNAACTVIEPVKAKTTISQSYQSHERRPDYVRVGVFASISWNSCYDIYSLHEHNTTDKVDHLISEVYNSLDGKYTVQALYISDA